MVHFLVAMAAFVSVSFSPRQVLLNSTVPGDTLARLPRLSTWLTGDTADVQRPSTGGTVLMGGSKDVDDAFRWMIQKSGGGDFVVIRASGSNGYNDYVYNRLGGVNSIETIMINSRVLANDPVVAQKIRNAEALFIAGGDQANYINFWKGTKVEEAINYLRNNKQVPVGGTSAGCAILSEVYFSALNGTITSADALTDPFSQSLTLGRADFLHMPLLQNTVTDMHFDQRDRRGRLITFLARMNTDWHIQPRGIAINERTAVCIEPEGTARVMGTGIAYFVTQTNAKGGPEQCRTGQPLHWLRRQQAIQVQAIQGTAEGSGTFNLVNWTADAGSKPQYWFVDKGVVGVKH